MMSAVANIMVDTSMSNKENIDHGKAMSIAMRYLARRDYSRLELYQKLIAKGLHVSVVDVVLEELQALGYQSDERFTEMFIRSRINSGDGPFKIKISLRGKGICDSLALAVFDKLDVDWFEQVKLIKSKRFGNQPSQDLNEISKQIRYLKNKGFYQDHINTVIDKII
jgi:regulatory protein